MMTTIRAVLAVMVLGLVASCGGDSAPKSKFKSYQGPPVTQVMVKKSERKMYLLSGNKALKTYKVDLGPNPKGPKEAEGDGRTPEGVYFINRQNPNSAYHLSLGISYPDDRDVARALAMGVKPGGDIMIHGRGAFGRSAYRPDWTAGCIAVTDNEIEDVFAMVRPGVPVVIYP